MLCIIFTHNVLHAVDYEGVDALVEDARYTEAVDNDIWKKTPILKEEVVDKEEVESVEETADEGSDDDFVAEPDSKRARAGKVSSSFVIYVSSLC